MKRPLYGRPGQVRDMIRDESSFMTPAEKARREHYQNVAFAVMLRGWRKSWKTRNAKPGQRNAAQN